jgi:DNA-binding transcriptional MerR regulator
VADYRIDDLARAAGTTVRNVRVYQDRGLLPGPRREGRVGVYGEAHLARLRLIGQLLERGYTFTHITELIQAWQGGHDLARVLGVEEAITGPWSDELPDYISAEDLVALFPPGELSPDLLARAIELDLLTPDGDRYLVPSPRLLQAGAELVAAGVPLAEVLELSAELAVDLDRVARRLVDTVAGHIEGKLPAKSDDRAMAEFTALVLRLRPLAQMAVEAHLARGMEHQVRAVFGDKIATAAEQAAGGAQAAS